MHNSHSSFSSVDESIPRYSISPIIALDVLQILGLLLNSATLCTAWFSSGIRRSLGWYSFTLSWIMTGIGHLFLVQHRTGPLPDSFLCLSSAMMMYASPPLNALTFFVFVLEIFLSTSDVSSISRTTMIVLYFVPYGVFASILTMVLILGRLNPSAVIRAPFGVFCLMTIGVPAYLSWAIVICGVAASLILGVRIILKYRKHRSVSRRLLIGTQFGLVLRVGIIGVLSILCIVLAIINMFEWDKTFTVFIFAMFPVTTGIIFGSQKDMRRVWMFWRKQPEARRITSVCTPREAELTNNGKTEPEDDNKNECISQHSIDHNIEFVVAVPT